LKHIVKYSVGRTYHIKFVLNNSPIKKIGSTNAVRVCVPERVT